MTKPDKRPKIMKNEDNIPAVNDCSGFTHLGAFITLTVRRYPLLMPKNTFATKLM